MKAAVRIPTLQMPSCNITHPLSIPQPPVGIACGEEQGWFTQGIFSICAAGTGSQVILDVPWEGNGYLYIPPEGAPLPKGDTAHLAQQLLWLPYKHPAWQRPSETLDMAQECICSHLLWIKICKIYFSQWTNSPNSALMKKLLPGTASRQNGTITS